MSIDIEQIRRAHRNAKPSIANPSWLNTHRDLGKALDALEQAQSKNVELSNCCDDYRLEVERLGIEHGDMNVANIKDEKRIEALEAALRRLHSLPVNDDTDSLMGFAGAVRMIAYEVLGSAGNTGHVHDWSDVDAFGWRRCRDTDCGAGLPPSTGDQGND